MDSIADFVVTTKYVCSVSAGVLGNEPDRSLRPRICDACSVLLKLKKVKLSHSKSWRLSGRTESWVSILTLALGTTRRGELSALRAGRSLPPWKFLGTHFCYRLSELQGFWMQTWRVSPFKISKDSTGNQTQDLPSRAAVPTMPRLTPLKPAEITKSEGRTRNRNFPSHIIHKKELLTRLSSVRMDSYSEQNFSVRFQVTVFGQ